MYTDEQVELAEKKRKNKLIKMVIIIASILIVIIIGIIIYLMFQISEEKKKQPSIYDPNAYVEIDKWTNGTMTVVVDDDQNLIKEYSFDGGNTWQRENKKVYEENCDVEVVVKDQKGLVSNVKVVNVKKIDKEPPVIISEDVSYVSMKNKRKYNTRTGVVAKDELSQVSTLFKAEPAEIDLSIEAAYTIQYTATDNAGNVTTKERVINVVDQKIKTTYRSRTATTEEYDCKAYTCECRMCNEATEKPKLSCNEGYTLENSKCFKDVVLEPDKETGTCREGYELLNNQCTRRQYGTLQKTCPLYFKLTDKTTCSSTKTYGECCNICYNKCKRYVWGEWSEWQEEKISAGTSREVEIHTEPIEEVIR